MYHIDSVKTLAQKIGTPSVADPLMEIFQFGINENNANTAIRSIFYTSVLQTIPSPARDYFSDFPYASINDYQAILSKHDDTIKRTGYACIALSSGSHQYFSDAVNQGAAVQWLNEIGNNANWRELGKELAFRYYQQQCPLLGHSEYKDLFQKLLIDIVNFKAGNPEPNFRQLFQYQLIKLIILGGDAKAVYDVYHQAMPTLVEGVYDQINNTDYLQMYSTIDRNYFSTYVDRGCNDNWETTESYIETVSVGARDYAMRKERKRRHVGEKFASFINSPLFANTGYKNSNNAGHNELEGGGGGGGGCTIL